jgi:hypothetical protein
MGRERPLTTLLRWADCARLMTQAVQLGTNKNGGRSAPFSAVRASMTELLASTHCEPCLPPMMRRLMPLRKARVLLIAEIREKCPLPPVATSNVEEGEVD